MTSGIEPISPATPSDVGITSSKSHLERLVDSLLFEGYALYPYTPGATKNATPTPFGIVYPADYAKHQSHAFDRMQMQGVVTSADAVVTGEVRFLQPSGEQHQAVERRVQLGAAPSTVKFEFGDLEGKAELIVERLPDGHGRVTLQVENITPLTDEEQTADRKEALLKSMLSTHLLARVMGAEKFISPLERGDDGVAGCCQVNTWPVLATPQDDALLAPTILLPEHPEIAPESVNDFFDGTEIEEALVLHIQALSDQEREEIAAQDPKVREMLARADATTPQQLMDLHGRVRIEDPPGERDVTFNGVRYRRGDKVILHPPQNADVYDKMLDGRSATIHRLFLRVDDRLHIGVTVDDDPMQEILGESGRFLFFFAEEVEVLT
ncbi:MAG: FIG00998299: hypothetical protein [uncultured Solirubrobacteraceae bacterium]|uniref:Uncharacterized protein n=1 Tax=uncultured Solirubrobacteraceae bacterium TaxID=1162706 RepID=A0A6J4TGP4_9ACTN|nr:MAG: FIG00998299: hypothetical protein [uncultured Solirubrobacteraceae bacterium]